jgi:hypothetical protein
VSPNRLFTLLLFALVGACRPPASDEYVQRIELGGKDSGPKVMQTSPVTEGAIWADGGPGRIMFGLPGGAPYLALACTGSPERPAFEVTRYAETDPRAKGIMALVGNGHVARLKIDAKWNGRGWLWHGRYRADDTRLDGFTGVRKLELTIPGAGTLVLEGSPRPGELIAACRALQAPPVSGPATPVPE